MTRAQQRSADRRAAKASLRRRAMAIALEDLAELPYHVRAQTLLTLYEEVAKGESRDDRRRAAAVERAKVRTTSIIQRISPEAVKPPRRRESPWWPLVGEPPDCQPGELWRAREFYDRLLRASEHPDSQHWTRGEKAALRVMLWRWGRRANGLDARFLRYGNVPGRLTADRRWTLALETIIWPVAHEPDASVSSRVVSDAVEPDGTL